MIDQTQMNRVALANQLPLNKVAIAFLPDDWGTSTEVAVLTLMRWGLDNGITWEPLAPHHPDSDQLMARINRMENWEPRRTMAFLTNPENGEDEETLNAAMLAEATTPQQAAAILLEHLYDAMVATAP
jgi:hypothetical protein